jgi:drug/metabolite transporter (DMT)-like permease
VHATGLRKVEVNIVGLFGLLEIVFACAFGTILFREYIGTIQATSVVLILAACAIPYLFLPASHTITLKPDAH